MSFNATIRLTLAAGAISTAAIACGGAPEVAKAPVVKQSGITFSAKASAKSGAALQITRWHSTVESGAHAAVVLDGQDRVGRVQYLQTAFIDAKTHTAHVQVMLPEKGEIVWDLDSMVVLSNTIPRSVQPYARGIYYDFQVAHPLRGGAVQAYSYLSGGVKIAAGAALVVGGAFVDASVLGVPVGAVMNAVGARLVAQGIVDVIYGSEKIAPDGAPKTTETAPPADSKDPAAATTNPAATGDKPADPAADPAAAVKDSVDAANPGASPPDAPAAPGTDPAATPPSGDPAAPGSDPASPGTQVADNSTPTPDNGAPASDPAGAAADGAALPPDNTGGNLDNVGAGATASDPGSGATASDPGNGGGGASDPGAGGGNPGAGGGDPGAGGGDPGAGGGDPGGDSESAHVCRKVAVSAKTKIRACVHY